MTPGQSSSPGGGPARAPQVLAKTSLISSMAMSQRTPSHCPAMSMSVWTVASRSARRERVQLHHVGPRREVRVTAMREDLTVTSKHASGRAPMSCAVPRMNSVRVVTHPRVVRRDVVGHVVQDQPGTAPAQLRAGGREPVGAAETLVDHVAPDAVRRADDVVRRQVGQRRAERGLKRGVARGRPRGRQGYAPTRPSARRRRRRPARRRPRPRPAPGRAGGRAPPARDRSRSHGQVSTS